MKKLVMLVASVAMVSAVSAQELSFGVKGGLNLANLTNADDSKMKPDFYLGATAEYKLSDMFGLGAELMYSGQGANLKATRAGVTVKGKSGLQYLNLPILVKFYPIEKLSIDLGPQFGFLLGAKQYAKAGDQVLWDAKETDGLTKVDLSLPIGATYQLTDNIDVQARYVIGLTDTNKDRPAGAKAVKNSVIQIGVAYRF